MKNYFIKLINYDKYANELMVKAIIENDKPEKAVKLMAHLLAAQQVWYNRCNKLPAVGGALWPDWEAETFEEIIKDNHLKWTAFLNGLDAADFDQYVSYKDSKGNEYSTKLEDVLAHLINHGTHHRAQAGQQLKLAGAETLPVTDYIFYVRNLHNS